MYEYIIEFAYIQGVRTGCGYAFGSLVNLLTLFIIFIIIYTIEQKRRYL